MLFGYPIEATQNNWLHDCLREAVRSIHIAIDAGENYPGWPTVLPVAFRTQLSRRYGLRNRLMAYDHVVRNLQEIERNTVLSALDDQNRIEDLLSGASHCATLDSLPHGIQKSITDLFTFAFDLLTDLGVRDQQYQKIYLTLSDHVCPFCGTEYFDAPGATREALDHYLASSRYAFAAANLRNLVPMGHKCNSSYKLAIDLLRDADGGGRVAFDPYMHTTLSVSLDGSDPFDGSTPNTPKWDIQFNPDTPAVSTWDKVFFVRERYQRDHLDPSFSRWLGEFKRWVRSTQFQPNTDDELVEALRRYEQLCSENGVRDRAFLKAAVFRMLRRYCESGHARLMELIRDLVAPPAALVGHIAH